MVGCVETTFSENCNNIVGNGDGIIEDGLLGIPTGVIGRLTTGVEEGGWEAN